MKSLSQDAKLLGHEPSYPTSAHAAAAHDVGQIGSMFFHHGTDVGNRGGYFFIGGAGLFHPHDAHMRQTDATLGDTSSFLEVLLRNCRNHIVQIDEVLTHLGEELIADVWGNVDQLALILLSIRPRFNRAHGYSERDKHRQKNVTQF